MEQVRENVECAQLSRVGILSEEDRDLVSRVQTEFAGRCPVPCTECAYCMPCPNGVDIPYNFRIYNEAAMHDDDSLDSSRWWYTLMAGMKGLEGDYHTGRGQAERCVQCGECEQKCPQSIPIGRWMEVVHRVLGEEEAIVRELQAG